MLIQAALLPLFVEVALTFVLLFWMGGLNIAAVQSGAVRPQEVALREPNWPARNRQVQNAYLNQLELPILFYVLTALSIVLRHADLVFVLLAWVFVALRCLQVFVHVTDNDVRRRGALFVSGAIVLAVMWAIFAIRILLGI
jgi:hypothetical protein